MPEHACCKCLVREPGLRVLFFKTGSLPHAAPHLNASGVLETSLIASYKWTLKASLEFLQQQGNMAADVPLAQE